MNPIDAGHIGVDTGDLVRVDTEIGYFVDSAWITEGIQPGIIAISRHLGRWRLQEDAALSKGASSLVTLTEDGKGGYLLRVLQGAQAWESRDLHTSRIWWSEVGVTQNLTHAVHPDPVSGVHCWLQKAKSVRKA